MKWKEVLATKMSVYRSKCFIQYIRILFHVLLCEHHSILEHLSIILGPSWNKRISILLYICYYKTLIF